MQVLQHKIFHSGKSASLFENQIRFEFLRSLLRCRPNNCAGTRGCAYQIRFSDLLYFIHSSSWKNNASDMCLASLFKLHCICVNLHHISVKPSNIDPTPNLAQCTEQKVIMDQECLFLIRITSEKWSFFSPIITVCLRQRSIQKSLRNHQ